jgi:transposase
MLHRRHLCGGEKRGCKVGTTKRGKGTKIMAIADGAGLPLAIHVESAAPHEVTLVAPTLATCFVDEQPERLIGDKAYDSDPLDARLAAEGIALIAPHRRNRTKPKTQDGRPLRRYKRRWKVERLIAWLQNFRRIIVRYEYYPENYAGFVQLGCLVILLRQYL